MLKFSAANVKIKSLSKVKSLKPFLANKRKVYSFDLLSGHSCPFAEECSSKVVIEGGKRKIKDGKKTKFRCFSASQEALFTNVYNSRKGNFTNLRQKSTGEIVEMIQDVLPNNLGICRIHVAGDFFSQDYFDAWIEIAKNNPDRLFYAYTKSLPYWVLRKESIPENFILTASYGGRRDNLIESEKLRSVKVVLHPEDTTMDIDHDDSHAADPTIKDMDFALLIHGTQPKGSEAAEAKKRLKNEGVQFSYSRAGAK
jgi:hypothetical protein